MLRAETRAQEEAGCCSELGGVERLGKILVTSVVVGRTTCLLELFGCYILAFALPCGPIIAS